MDNTLQLKIITSLQDKLSGPLKKIRGVTGESAKSLKDLRDKLKGLESTQKSIQSFRKLSDDLKGTNTAMQAAQDKVNTLAKAMKSVENPTKAMRTEFNRAVAEARKLTDQSKNQSVALQALRSKLSDSGVSTRNLSQQERELRSNIQQTSTALKQQTDQLRRAADQQNKLAKAKEKYQSTQQLASNMAITGAGGVATGAAILAPVKSVLDAFAPAEDAYTQLKVAMMDASGNVSNQFNEVKTLAIELGDRLPGTTADFINMMTMLKRQGMSDQTILGGLGESAANLSVLLKLPVEAAAEFSAKMQDALQAPESEMMQITDGLQRMFYAGVDSNNILEGFSKMGPALGIVGKKGHDAFQMISPMLAMFDQTSMAGEAAGNALRKVFQRSIDTDKIEKANDVLKDFKLKTKLDFTDGKGEFGGLEHMFKQLQKIEKLNSVQRGMVLKELFGDDAETLQVVNTLMGKGMEGYTEMLQKMEKQASLTDRVKAQLGTLTNVSEAASGSFTNAMSDIGETVAPELKKLIEWLGNAANKLGEFTRANPELVALLVKIIAVTGALIAAFGFLTIALASVIGPFAMIKYGLAMIAAVASPVVLIVGVIVAALVGAAYLIYKNWNFLKAKFSEIWTAIKTLFSDGWEAVSNMTSNAWSSVSNLFSTSVASVSGYLSGFWADTKNYFSNGFAELTNVITQWNPVQTFQSVFGTVSGFFGGLVSDFSGFGQNLIQGLVDGIKGMAGQAKEAIENVGSGVVGWFKDKLGIRSPSRVFIEMGGFISEGAAIGIERQQSAAMKAAKHMAASVMMAGAMVPMTASGMSVNGNELAPIRFDTRAPLTSAGSRSPGAPVMQGGDKIEIHIHAAGMNPQEIARVVSLELDRRQAQKQSRRRSSYVDYGN